MTTEHNKATPEGNVTCCPHVSDGASSTKEPHNQRHFPRSVRLPAAAQPLSSSPHGSTRLLAKFPVCRTALLAYWINLLLLGITLYFSGGYVPKKQESCKTKCPEMSRLPSNAAS